MVHPTTYWRVRCIQDSSDEENTPPNVDQGSDQDEASAVKAASVASGSKDRPNAKQTEPVESDSSTGTVTPPWVTPQHGIRVPKADTNPAPPEPTTGTTSSMPPSMRNPLSPTTSSPVLLETPQSPPPPRTRPRPLLRERRSARQDRRAAAAPYVRRGHMQPPSSPMVNPSGLMRTSLPPATRAGPRAARPRDRFVPAKWPFRVSHLREPFNPLGTIFPAVPHFGWCDCSSPCRVGTCRNSLMQLYCNRNCCPYEGMCGNGLSESTKVGLARNARTRQLSVVATEDIMSGEVLGQYLGELEHVSISPENRPRNEGYRLVMRQRPETPSHPICVAINARHLGGLMRFANHSCEPVATFHEVANGRRTTVVVATTEDVLQGKEITVDYGDDLWFVCR